MQGENLFSGGLGTSVSDEPYGSRGDVLDQILDWYDCWYDNGDAWYDAVESPKSMMAAHTIG